MRFAFVIMLPLLLLAACASPSGNPNVVSANKPVDLDRYSGVWYEYARYENFFERGCENVTAQYFKRPDGLVDVTNTCVLNDAQRTVKITHGKAKVLPNSNNSKLKVSFAGPFYFGDYWILDRAEDYSWSIVGEGSGKYLWLLTRDKHPSETTVKMMMAHAEELGYYIPMLEKTVQK